MLVLDVVALVKVVFIIQILGSVPTNSRVSLVTLIQITHQLASLTQMSGKGHLRSTNERKLKEHSSNINQA